MANGVRRFDSLSRAMGWEGDAKPTDAELERVLKVARPLKVYRDQCRRDAIDSVRMIARMDTSRPSDVKKQLSNVAIAIRRALIAIINLPDHLRYRLSSGEFLCEADRVIEKSQVLAAEIIVKRTGNAQSNVAKKKLAAELAFNRGTRARSRRARRVLGRPVERRRPAARRGRARGSRAVGVPRARGVARAGGAGGGPRCPPPASRAAAATRAAAPRARPRPAVADGQRGGGRRAARRRSSRRSSSSSATRRRTIAPPRLVGRRRNKRARRAPAARARADVRVLGQPRDRALDAAAARVGGQPQPAPVAPPPQLEQRRREQRQRAGLALDVGEQRVGELRLDGAARPAGRPLDRAPQLVARHRPDQHVVGAEQPRQLRVGRAAPVEVGADARPRRAVAGARSATSASTNSAARLVLARREQLLELVDREHPAPWRGSPVARSSARARMLAGPDHRLRPVLAARAARRPRAPAAARRARPTTCRCRTAPTTPSSGAPTSRATSSATSALAPEEVLGVVARRTPRGPCTGRRPASRAGPSARRARASTAARRRCRRARPRAPQASPRPAAARSASASTRAAAARRAHSLAASWTRRGDPAAVSSSCVDRDVAAGRGIEAAMASDGLGVERLEHERLARLEARAAPPPRRPVASTSTGAAPSRERAQRRADLGGRAVGVVEHEQRRPPASRARASAASATSARPSPDA